MDIEVLAAIERDWSQSSLSPRLIRIKHGLTDEAQVLSLAETHRWGDRKSIGAKIHDGVLHSLVSSHAADSQAGTEGGVLIDDEAELSAYTKHVGGVIRDHHSGLARGRNLADRMLVELEQIQPPEIDPDAIASLAATIEADNPELAKHLRAHVGPVNPKEQLVFLGKRIALLGTLSQTQVTYINAERIAYGMDQHGNGEGAQFDDVVDVARERLERR